MTKLTEAQRLVLLSACNQESGLATRPANLKGAAASKMITVLTEKALAKEVRAKPGASIWREEEGRGYALKILKAGRSAVALDGSSIADAQQPGGKAAAPASDKDDTAAIGGPKTTLIVGLMQRKHGATLRDLEAATGWLPHTTRAALSGLRKKGVAIQRLAGEQDVGSVYRIEAGTAPKSA